MRLGKTNLEVKKQILRRTHMNILDGLNDNQKDK